MVMVMITVMIMVMVNDSARENGVGNCYDISLLVMVA